MSGIAAGLYATTAGPQAQIRVRRAGEGWLAGISGDIVRSDERIVSFVLDQGAISESADGIAGRANLFSSSPGGPRTALVRLSPAPAVGGTPAIAARLDPGRGEVRLVLVRQGPAFRRLALTLDAVEGLDLPDQSILDGPPAAENLRAVMAGASIAVAEGAEIRVRRNLDGRALDPRQSVNPAELHEMLEAWGDPPASPGLSDWRLHVVFAGRLEGDRKALGLMYDTRGTAADPPRQGLAVFLDSEPLVDLKATSAEDWRRQVLFTLAHEIGHALNLPHCFERGAADALTWMNYPHRFAAGEAAFWDGFRNCYDPTELDFLCHAPHVDIAPGASNYAARTSLLITGGGADPDDPVALSAADERVRAAAALVPLKARPLYRFGEPVFLRFTLANTGPRPFLYPRSFDPSDGLLTVTVTRPDGHSRTLRPAMSLCQRHPEARLKPGARASFDGIFASFDADGPLFDAPGRYVLSARFGGLPGRPLATPPSALRVLHPTRAEEIAAVTVWDDPGLMRAIYLRQPLLARERWNALLDACGAITREGADPEDTTGAFLRYTAALGWMQRFAPASSAVPRRPDLGKARAHLRACQHRNLPSGARTKLRRLQRRESAAVRADPPEQ
ncbi:MAG: hypothetical protein PGN34_19705 [Methylobacterium frigidaeris]